MKPALALCVWFSAAPLWAANQAKPPAPLLRNYRQTMAGNAFKAYLTDNAEVDLPNLRLADLLAKYPHVDKARLWTQFGAPLQQKLAGLVHRAQAPDSAPAQVGQVEEALRLVKHVFKAQMTPSEQLQLRDLQSRAASAQAAAVKRDMEGKALALVEGTGKKAAEADTTGTSAGAEAPAANAQPAFQALADLLHDSKAGAVANGLIFYKLVRLARTNAREERLLLGILAQLAYYGIQKETSVERMLQRLPDIESVAEVAQSEEVKVQAIAVLMDSAAQTRSHRFAEQASQAVKRLGTREGSGARVRETAYAYLMREAKLAVGSGPRKAALGLAEEVRQAASKATIDLRVISLSDPAAHTIARRRHLLGQVQDAASTPAGLAATLLASAASLAAAGAAVATGLLAVPVAVLAGLLTFWVGLQGLRHRAIGWAFTHMGLIAGHIAAIASLSLMWAAANQPERAVLAWILGGAGLAFNALFSRKSFDRGDAAGAALIMYCIAALSIFLMPLGGRGHG